MKISKQEFTSADITASVVRRFWAQVVKTESCWNWVGSDNGNGYGYMHGGGRRHGVHRISYVIHGGVLQPGLVIDHICRNRSCVNPEHLRQVTQRVNALENSSSISAINSAKTTCPKGHPYTEENTWISRGARKCRTCSLARSSMAQKKRYGTLDASGAPTGKPLLRRVRPSSGFRGVSRADSKKNPWRAVVTENGRFKTLGTFPTAEAAAKAYDSYAKEQFGKWAILNFPEAAG